MSLIACAAITVLLTACGRGKPFYRAAATEGDGANCPVQQTVTPYLEATGNVASVNNVKLVARVQGYVQEIKYQDGAGGEEGHAAVRDRAGALQGQAGAGPGSGGGRQGDARQCRSRIHAAAGTAGQGRLDPGQSRQGAGQPRHGARQCAAGTGQYPDRGDQSRLHHGVGPVRRRRHRAQGLGRRTGRRRPAERACDHRPAAPDLGVVQPQRTRRAARPRHRWRNAA